MRPHVSASTVATLLGLLMAGAAGLSAQNGGSAVIDFGSNIIDSKSGGVNIFGFNLLISNIKYTWQITRADNGDKTFSFVAYKCIYSVVGPDPILGGILVHPLLSPDCKLLSQTDASNLAPVSAAFVEFYDLAPGEVNHYVKYGPFIDTRPRVSTVQPSVLQNPQAVMLDGFGNRLLRYDFTTGAITGQVIVPSTVGPLGMRPSDTGAPNEVWVANGGLQVTVTDLNAGKVITNILTPSVPVAASPANIVFTNSGNTALEAVSYFTPDSAGNNGALLVFDVVNRKVTSTLQLKYQPQSLLMAPDGLTAYIIGGGKITYYDVVSGTADLTAPFTFFSGNAFIHPDGTRLFFGTGPVVNVFDLTTRKFTTTFNSGLPGTSGTALQMSQDGSTFFLSNGQGDVALMDTRYGQVVATYNTKGASQLLGGAASAGAGGGR